MSPVNHINGTPLRSETNKHLLPSNKRTTTSSFWNNVQAPEYPSSMLSKLTRRWTSYWRISLPSITTQIYFPTQNATIPLQQIVDVYVSDSQLFKGWGGISAVLLSKQKLLRKKNHLDWCWPFTLGLGNVLTGTPLLQTIMSWNFRIHKCRVNRK